VLYKKYNNYFGMIKSKYSFIKYNFAHFRRYSETRKKLYNTRKERIGEYGLIYILVRLGTLAYIIYLSNNDLIWVIISFNFISVCICSAHVEPKILCINRAISTLWYGIFNKLHITDLYSNFKFELLCTIF
jgi:hypothetical protein